MANVGYLPFSFVVWLTLLTLINSAILSYWPWKSRHTVMCQRPRKPCGKQVCYLQVKTHGRVSVVKKTVWYTSVLFTRTANLPFSTPHISTTTGLISIKFICFMPSIYATLHTKFEINQPSSSWDICSWKLPNFLYLSLLLCTILQK